MSDSRLEEFEQQTVTENTQVHATWVLGICIPMRPSPNYKGSETHQTMASGPMPKNFVLYNRFYNTKFLGCSYLHFVLYSRFYQLSTIVSILLFGISIYNHQLQSKKSQKHEATIW